MNQPTIKGKLFIKRNQIRKNFQSLEIQTFRFCVNIFECEIHNEILL